MLKSIDKAINSNYPLTKTTLKGFKIALKKFQDASKEIGDNQKGTEGDSHPNQGDYSQTLSHSLELVTILEGISSLPKTDQTDRQKVKSDSSQVQEMKQKEFQQAIEDFQKKNFPPLVLTDQPNLDDTAQGSENPSMISKLCDQIKKYINESDKLTEQKGKIQTIKSLYDKLKEIDNLLNNLAKEKNKIKITKQDIQSAIDSFKENINIDMYLYWYTSRASRIQRKLLNCKERLKQEFSCIIGEKELYDKIKSIEDLEKLYDKLCLNCDTIVKDIFSHQSSEGQSSNRGQLNEEYIRNTWYEQTRSARIEKLGFFRQFINIHSQEKKQEFSIEAYASRGQETTDELDETFKVSNSPNASDSQTFDNLEEAITSSNEFVSGLDNYHKKWKNRTDPLEQLLKEKFKNFKEIYEQEVQLESNYLDGYQTIEAIEKYLKEKYLKMLIPNLSEMRPSTAAKPETVKFKIKQSQEQINQIEKDFGEIGRNTGDKDKEITEKQDIMIKKQGELKELTDTLEGLSKQYKYYTEKYDDIHLKLPEDLKHTIYELERINKIYSVLKEIEDLKKEENGFDKNIKNICSTISLSFNHLIDLMASIKENDIEINKHSKHLESLEKDTTKKGLEYKKEKEKLNKK